MNIKYLLNFKNEQQKKEIKDIANKFDTTIRNILLYGYSLVHEKFHKGTLTKETFKENNK